MEKKKIWKTLGIIAKVVVLVGFLTVAFYASVWAGLFAILAGGIGYMCGYNNHVTKLIKACASKVVENKEQVLSGKLLTLSCNLETNEVSVQLSAE